MIGFHALPKACDACTLRSTAMLGPSHPGRSGGQRIWLRCARRFLDLSLSVVASLIKMLVPTPPKHGLHRRAFLQTLTSALLVATPSLPALAAYTIVPTGSIADKQARQLEVAKELKVTPDDPYLFGERAQLEFDIAKLENNTKFINRVRPRVESGEQRFSTRLTVPVPDMAVAVTFWTAGCGALLLDTRIVDGRNVTRIGYGPESLRKDDGGKFSLELVESAEPSQMGAENAVVQYIQLGIPVFRLSRVMATGGEIVSAYGGMACQDVPWAISISGSPCSHPHRLSNPPACRGLPSGPERSASAACVPARCLRHVADPTVILYPLQAGRSS